MGGKRKIIIKNKCLLFKGQFLACFFGFLMRGEERQGTGFAGAYVRGGGSTHILHAFSPICTYTAIQPGHPAATALIIAQTRIF